MAEAVRAGASLRRPVFAPELGCVADSAVLGQAFFRVLRLSPVTVIPPLLISHLSLPHEVCDSSDQVKLGASSLTQHLAGKEEVINGRFGVRPSSEDVLENCDSQF
jgi:hypothetical protein